MLKIKKAYSILVMFGILILSSCKVNKLKDGVKYGKWIEQYAEGSYSVGRYRNGAEIGTWKQFDAGKLFRKERFKRSDSVTLIKCYFPNGRLSSKGRSRFESNNQELRWFYFGIWKYYNQSGKLTHIRLFEKGEIVKEIRFAAM